MYNALGSAVTEHNTRMASLDSSSNLIRHFLKFVVVSV